MGRPLELNDGTSAVRGHEVDQECLLDASATCDNVDPPDMSGGVWGPDGLVFTAADPWLTNGRGARLTE